MGPAVKTATFFYAICFHYRSNACPLATVAISWKCSHTVYCRWARCRRKSMQSPHSSRPSRRRPTPFRRLAPSPAVASASVRPKAAASASDLTTRAPAGVIHRRHRGRCRSVTTRTTKMAAASTSGALSASETNSSAVADKPARRAASRLTAKF